MSLETDSLDQLALDFRDLRLGLFDQRFEHLPTHLPFLRSLGFVSRPSIKLPSASWLASTLLAHLAVQQQAI
jgi:hypothetical protein